MGSTDLIAVACRREVIGHQLVELQTKRAALVAENDELEVAERVLNQLADYFVAQPIVARTPIERQQPSTHPGAIASLTLAIARYGRVVHEAVLSGAGTVSPHIRPIRLLMGKANPSWVRTDHE